MKEKGVILPIDELAWHERWVKKLKKVKTLRMRMRMRMKRRSL